MFAPLQISKSQQYKQEKILINFVHIIIIINVLQFALQCSTICVKGGVLYERRNSQRPCGVRREDGG